MHYFTIEGLIVEGVRRILEIQKRTYYYDESSKKTFLEFKKVVIEVFMVYSKYENMKVSHNFHVKKYTTTCLSSFVRLCDDTFYIPYIKR